MSTSVSFTHPINGFSIFTLIVFFGVNILVIFPIRIPVPRKVSKAVRKAAEGARLIDRKVSGDRGSALAAGNNVANGSTSRRQTDQQDGMKKLESRDDHEAIEAQHGQGKQHPIAVPTASAAVTGGDQTKTAATTTPAPKATQGHSASPEPGSSPAADAASNSDSNSGVHLELGLGTAPVIGVLLLLATTAIGGQTLRDGIVGAGGVKPYDIMTLFISLAYISLSLDCTGLLRFLAFWVALKGGRSGKRLYLFFFAFFFVFGTLVGNDPIILSGTSFLAYFSRIAGISPPRAWIFAQFAACNVASAVLVSSNPTNLVLTGAYDISFLVYSAWLVLPVLATAVCLYPLLLFVSFRNPPELIPAELEPPDVDPRTALIDRQGAIFGSCLLAVTLAALVGLSAGGLLHGVEGVWTVTAPAAIVMLVRDLWHDRRSQSSKRPQTRAGGDGEEVEMEDVNGDGADAQGADDLSGAKGLAESGQADKLRLGAQVDETKLEEDKASSRPPTGPRQRTISTGRVATSAAAGNALNPTPSNGKPVASSSASTIAEVPVVVEPSAPTPRPQRTLTSTVRQLSRRFPTFAHIFVRLPLPLLPFAFSMFILVEALQYVGWIRIFGGWWAAWVKVSGVAGAVFLMGMLSVIGCNIFGTNIGATILLSRVLQQWSQSEANVSKRTLYGAVFTLALGSNYGAFSFTFSASLAGLLWKTILLQKGIKVGRWEFAKNNALLVVVCMIIGCLVIAGEVCVIYKD